MNIKHTSSYHHRLCKVGTVCHVNLKRLGVGFRLLKTPCACCRHPEVGENLRNSRVALHAWLLQPLQRDVAPGQKCGNFIPVGGSRPVAFHSVVDRGVLSRLHNDYIPLSLDFSPVFAH